MFSGTSSLSLVATNKSVEKTLFVLGAPRSGTTLLINFLVMNQPKITGSVFESQFYTNANRKPYILSTFTEDHYFSKLLAPEVINEIFSTSTDHINFFRNAILYKLNQSKTEIFIEKSPMHTLFFKRILKDFENVEFILINRNPFSNIQSIAFTKWIPLQSDILPGNLKSKKSIRYFLSTYLYYKYWMISKRVAKHPKCKLVLSYEDIILEKVNVKEELEQALGITLNELYVARPYSDAVTHKNRILDKTRIDDYKNVMPLYVQRYVKAIFQPDNLLDQIIRLPIILLYEFFRFVTYLIEKK